MITEGTPEVRLWSAVVLTLIDDARDDINNQISQKGISVAETRWTNRAMDRSFQNILEIAGVHPSDLLGWLLSFAETAKRTLHRRLQKEGYALPVEHLAVRAAGLKCRY